MGSSFLKIAIFRLLSFFLTKNFKRKLSTFLTPKIMKLCKSFLVFISKCGAKETFLECNVRYFSHTGTSFPSLVSGFWSELSLGSRLPLGRCESSSNKLWWTKKKQTLVHLKIRMIVDKLLVFSGEAECSYSHVWFWIWELTKTRSRPRWLERSGWSILGHL